MAGVLIVHNRYQQAGGEDAVVANEYEMLKRHGWQPRLWSVTNDGISGVWSKIAAATRASYSRFARDELSRVIAECAPSVVHVHNFFPLLSPSVYDACRAAGIAVVQTLHNYRTICPGALLMRDGRPCEDCIGASPYQSVLHGCYRGSHLASLAVARMVDVHRRRQTWSRKVDRFIVLSQFARGRFIAAGFPAGRIVIKPNFAEDRRVLATAPRAGALYVGRLSEEKGIRTLLRAWEGLDVPLRIVGDGPLRELVDQTANPSIVALGRQPRAEVAAEMARAAFLILPSIWSELMPLVTVEAFCQGLPIVASHHPALEEIVEDGVTGLLFALGDAVDLAAKVRWACLHAGAMALMGSKTRQVYEDKYSPSSNFRQLAAIYEAAIMQSRTVAAERHHWDSHPRHD